MSTREFIRDPDDWLRKLSPSEWIRAGLGELSRAEEAYGQNNARAAIAGCKRAAGMALNAVLIFEPNAAWGRTYVEHVAALASDPNAPQRLREACSTILDAHPPAGAKVTPIVTLRTPTAEKRVVEAAKDVVAHAFALVKRHEGLRGIEEPS